MALQVCETFVSLMGESSFAGLPGFFIRLSGCNLRCRYCDTTYAYAGGTERTIESLAAEAAATGLKLVLVTGGEPLVQEECPAALKPPGRPGVHRPGGDQRLPPAGRG